MEGYKCLPTALFGRNKTGSVDMLRRPDRNEPFVIFGIYFGNRAHAKRRIQAHKQCFRLKGKPFVTNSNHGLKKKCNNSNDSSVLFVPAFQSGSTIP